MRLLLIEDDTALNQELSQQLRKHGFAVDSEKSGVDGAFMGETEPYDVIILDLGLPDLSGLDILSQWRNKHIATPVLILTARSAWHEKVDGFKAGADDYLTKPFHIEELIVRLQALIRRSAGINNINITIGGLSLDESTQSAHWQPTTGEKHDIQLTGIEFRLLRYFMLHPRKILSATHLLEHVYDFDDEKESNVIQVYINRLRNRIGKEAICTRRGQGYYLNPDALQNSK